MLHFVQATNVTLGATKFLYMAKQCFLFDQMTVLGTGTSLAPPYSLIGILCNISKAFSWGFICFSNIPNWSEYLHDIETFVVGSIKLDMC